MKGSKLPQVEYSGLTVTPDELDVWMKGRIFDLATAEEREICFPRLLEGSRSPNDLERIWAVEALYRNLWGMTPAQQKRALDFLINRLEDSNEKCVEYAAKGVQYGSEMLSSGQAEILLDKLFRLNPRVPEVVRTIAIELAYCLLLRFGYDRHLVLRATELLMTFHKDEPDRVERTAGGIDQLEASTQSLTIGIPIKPIGIVRNGYTELSQLSSFSPSAQSRIIIWPEYTEALNGLEGFSHIFIVCYLDRQRDWEPITQVSWNGQELQIGVFATTSPKRKNPVFSKLGRLLEIRDNTLIVAGIKVLDRTPIIDIKPYIASKFEVEDSYMPEWAQSLYPRKTERK